MKKFVVFMVAALFLSAAPAWALTIDAGATNVGSQDPYLAGSAADLNSSGAGAELAWLQSKIGTGYTIVNNTNTIAGDWVEVDQGGYWALELVDSPDYFFIKTGQTVGGYDHFLFTNLAELNWAVISLTDFGPTTIANIGKVSHVGETEGTAVPEPTTMLLLGFGLVGLAGVRKFRK